MTKTEDYFARQDLIGQWLEECTEQVPGARVGAGDAYTHFMSWCSDEWIGDRAAFKAEMKQHGVGHQRRGGGSYFLGIKLLPFEPDLIGQWLEECTERAPRERVGAAAALSNFREWCLDTWIGDRAAFKTEMKRHGVGHTRRGRSYFMGIKFKQGVSL